MKRNTKIFLETLKKSLAGFAAGLLFLGGSLAVFFLYRLPLEPFLYVFALLLAFGGVLFAVTLRRELTRARARERMGRTVLTGEALPAPESLAEEDYQTVIRRLEDELSDLRDRFGQARQEEIDYYTAWVHQIKTPIAVMRMELGGRDTDTARALEAELFRIEQYVDMVLQYIRLGSDANDLVVKEYPLDELIRECVRKYAPQFVAKRLRFDYAGTDRLLVTDRKWFACILEQLLSNAIKYTPSGGIGIALEGDLLTVTDTGIGIAPEDLPRIFEKGFTGENGRLEKRSSGLGLYLCKKACDLLRVPISVTSRVGAGSTFTLDLGGKM